MTQPAINEELKVLSADPTRLRSALDEADAATLLLVLVQFTGESEWLEKARPYIAGPMSYQEKMPTELRREIRARLFDVLMERAGSAAPLPALPAGKLLSDMLSIAAGEPLGDEYLRMMSEELAPAPEGLPLFEATPGLDAPADFRVLIIGAGMSGLCAAIRLKQAGVNFSIIEKNATVGGTWLENSYPGCGVDTPNHFYSYSFAPHHDWSMLFAKRRELWDYFERVADEYGIRERITFDTEVESAVFNEQTNLWRIVTHGKDGKLAGIDVNVVISCVGVLNRPKIPELPGLEEFRGPKFHTAQWDADFDWQGKKGGNGWHRRLRSSGRSDDSPGCRQTDYLSALAALDRAQSKLLRACSTRSEMAAGPPPLLFALVSLPVVLGLFRRPVFGTANRPCVG